MGDDQGCVSLMELHPNDLATRPSKIEEEKTYLIAHHTQNQLINSSIKQLHIHNDWVLRAEYLPELRCVVSCSTDENTALALTQPECFKYQSAYNSVKGNMLNL